MKKITALVLTLVMAFSLFTGCSNPVADELTKFVNEDMAVVIENYTAITEEAALWGTYEEDAQMTDSINNVLLPLVEENLNILSKITLETDEVKALKAQFVEVMNAYKEGFVTIVDGIEAQDEAKMVEGTEIINNGLAILDDYNANANALAEANGLEFEE